MEGLSDRIAAVRIEVINQLLGVAQSRVDRCIQLKETLCQSNSHNARPEDCDAIVLGSFIRGLQELDVLLRRGNRIPLSIMRMSIEEFANKLNTMNMKSPHTQCSGSLLKQAVTETLRSIPDPVLDSHRRHMEAQSGRRQ